MKSRVFLRGSVSWTVAWRNGEEVCFMGLEVRVSRRISRRIEVGRGGERGSCGVMQVHRALYRPRCIPKHSVTIIEHQTFPWIFAAVVVHNVRSILQKKKRTPYYTTTFPPPFLPSILQQCIISPNLPRPILPRRRLTRVLTPRLLARSRIMRTLEPLRALPQSHSTQHLSIRVL